MCLYNSILIILNEDNKRWMMHYLIVIPHVDFQHIRLCVMGIGCWFIVPMQEVCVLATYAHLAWVHYYIFLMWYLLVGWDTNFFIIMCIL